jgi:hypothetical protein
MTRIFSRAAAIATSAAVAALVTAGSAGAANASAPGSGVQHVGPKAAVQIGSGRIRLSRAELAQWRRETATPAGRAELVAELQKSFAGIARVSTGARPQTAASTGHARPDLAVGKTGNHVWIIASYADMADGAIWSGVAACAAYLPELFDFCEEIGDIMSSWAEGWGRASNHGVWAAIYWLPPHWAGGRW